MAVKKSHKVANRALMEAMQEIRRSSASSPHVPTSRKGSRSSNKAKAIRESWSN